MSALERSLVEGYMLSRSARNLLSDSVKTDPKTVVRLLSLVEALREARLHLGTIAEQLSPTGEHLHHLSGLNLFLYAVHREISGIMREEKRVLSILENASHERRSVETSEDILPPANVINPESVEAQATSPEADPNFTARSLENLRLLIKREVIRPVLIPLPPGEILEEDTEHHPIPVELPKESDEEELRYLIPEDFPSVPTAGGSSVLTTPYTDDAVPGKLPEMDRSEPTVHEMESRDVLGESATSHTETESPGWYGPARALGILSMAAPGDLSQPIDSRAKFIHSRTDIEGEKEDDLLSVQDRGAWTGEERGDGLPALSMLGSAARSITGKNIPPPGGYIAVPLHRDRDISDPSIVSQGGPISSSSSIHDGDTGRSYPGGRTEETRKSSPESAGGRTTQGIDTVSGADGVEEGRPSSIREKIENDQWRRTSRAEGSGRKATSLTAVGILSFAIPVPLSGMGRTAQRFTMVGTDPVREQKTAGGSIKRSEMEHPLRGQDTPDSARFTTQHQFGHSMNHDSSVPAACEPAGVAASSANLHVGRDRNVSGGRLRVSAGMPADMSHRTSSDVSSEDTARTSDVQAEGNEMAYRPDKGDPNEFRGSRTPAVAGITAPGSRVAVPEVPPIGDRDGTISPHTGIGLYETAVARPIGEQGLGLVLPVAAHIGILAGAVDAARKNWLEGLSGHMIGSPAVIKRISTTIPEIRPPAATPTHPLMKERMTPSITLSRATPSAESTGIEGMGSPLPTLVAVTGGPENVDAGAPPNVLGLLSTARTRIQAAGLGSIMDHHAADSYHNDGIPSPFEGKPAEVPARKSDSGFDTPNFEPSVAGPVPEGESIDAVPGAVPGSGIGISTYTGVPPYTSHIREMDPGLTGIRHRVPDPVMDGVRGEARHDFPEQGADMARTEIFHRVPVPETETISGIRPLPGITRRAFRMLKGVMGLAVPDVSVPTASASVSIPAARMEERRARFPSQIMAGTDGTFGPGPSLDDGRGVDTAGPEVTSHGRKPGAIALLNTYGRRMMPRARNERRGRVDAGTIFDTAPGTPPVPKERHYRDTGFVFSGSTRVGDGPGSALPAVPNTEITPSPETVSIPSHYDIMPGTPFPDLARIRMEHEDILGPVRKNADLPLSGSSGGPGKTFTSTDGFPTDQGERLHGEREIHLANGQDMISPSVSILPTGMVPGEKIDIHSGRTPLADEAHMGSDEVLMDSLVALREIKREELDKAVSRKMERTEKKGMRNREGRSRRERGGQYEPEEKEMFRIVEKMLRREARRHGLVFP